MNLETLTPLKQIGTMKKLNPLFETNRSRYLDSVELICYAVDLTYYLSKIQRNEIVVENENEILTELSKEVLEVSRMLNKDYSLIFSNYTNKSRKEFYKKVKLTNRYLKV